MTIIEKLKVDYFFLNFRIVVVANGSPYTSLIIFILIKSTAVYS
jgi:hypothetical protein